jgi:hypothetical protein
MEKNKIGEIIMADGEVLSMSSFGSENEFFFKILNSLEFENVKAFFIKKTIIEAVKEKHLTSNGSNGVTIVELLNLFKWSDIQTYTEELEQKKIIKKRQGINSEMFFIYKK